MNKILISVAISLACFSAPSQSNELEKVWDMMLSTGTGSQAYSSDTRNGLTLGAARIRIKTYNPNLIAIRAPYLQVGCQGIDFFGGSLSILKKEELVQMGRSLVAAAPMYAFQLAFDQICPDCNAIMADLAERLEGLNDLVKGDCASITNAFDNITGLGSKRGESDKKMWDKYTKAADSYLPDFASGLMDKKNLAGEADLQKKSGAVLSYNSTYEALKSLNGWQFILGNDTRVSAQLLMSILGTEINTVDGSLTSSAADGGQSKLETKSPTITLMDLYQRKIDDSGVVVDSIKVLKCAASEASDPNCWKVDEVTVSPSDTLYMAPFKSQIEELMCGTATGGNNFSTSLMSRIPRKGATSTKQQDLMKKMGPLYREFISRNSGSDSQALQNCEVISAAIAVQMAISLGDELIQIASGIRDSPKATEDKFVDLRARVKTLREDQKSLLSEREDIHAQILTSTAITQALKGSSK